MAEDSLLWTTNDTGDGAAAGYTMAETVSWQRMLWLNDPDTEGVALGFLNDLEVTDIGGRDLQIDTGGGLVYGYPYWNDSAVTKGLTHPVIDTTGWRLVLRASWAAQTVRITLLESADGVAAIPDVTHNSGVTWDVSIAYGTITTGDVVDITDDPHYLAPNIEVVTAMIASDAVTPVKILDRERKFLVQCVAAYNDTDSTAIVRDDPVGWPLPDEKLSQAFCNFYVPSDYVSDLTVEAVVTPNANGDIRSYLSLKAGASGQTPWTHTGGSTVYAETTIVQDDIELINSGAVAALAAGDFVYAEFRRAATAVQDTIGDIVLLHGFLVSYTADS